MRVRTHVNPTDDVLDAWQALVRRDPVGTPFHGPTWARTWVATRGEGADLVLRVVEDDDGPVAAFPEVATVDGATFPGGTDVTDYRGPVGDPEHRAGAAAAWLGALAEDGVTSFAWHGVPADAGWLDAVEAAAGDLGWSVEGRAREDVCPRVDLAPDGADPAAEPEAWLEAIDGKERHELRRKGRKLARDLGGTEVVEASADDLPAALDRFWELAQTSEGDKGEFFRDPGHRAFFEAQVAAFAGSGTLRIHELLAGGLPAASMVSLVDDREWGLYNSALDPALAAFAPGTVLAAELCTLAAREGLRTFDFLRGDEDYKYRFGAVDRVIEQATLRRTV